MTDHDYQQELDEAEEQQFMSQIMSQKREILPLCSPPYCSRRDGRGYICTQSPNHLGEHIAQDCDGGVCVRWSEPEPIRVVERTRKARLLSLTTGGTIYMSTLARVLNCPEASIRRSIQELRAEGYYIVLDNKSVTNYGLRSALISDPHSSWVK